MLSKYGLADMSEKLVESELDLYFMKDANVKKIFSNVGTAIVKNPHRAHLHIGARWHQFSEQMPSLLALMIIHSSDCSEQNRYARILFEELGSGNDSLIHSKLYFNALEKSGLSIMEIDTEKLNYPLNEIGAIKSAIKMSSPSKILGISMGLELVAQENIKHLAKCFIHSGSCQKFLDNDLFFQIHFENEINHIKLNLSNYYGLKSEAEKCAYREGVNLSLTFWLEFWQNNIGHIFHPEKIE